MDRLYARVRADRATSCSTSARMWATASRRSAGSAPASSPSSRSPRWRRRCGCSTGATQAVTIEAVAVGRASGTVALQLNLDNPTVSTASRGLHRSAADGAPGWHGQAWTRSIEVAVTTLDALIARHGAPAFTKIDVEGFEAEVLHGLTQADPGAVVRIYHDPTRRRARLPRALPGARVRPLQCGARREPGAGARELAGRAERSARWLAALPIEANSGDIYARLAYDA